MAKYGVNYYGASKYGAFTKLAYSVDPMSTLVLDFSRVLVSWQSPRGTFSQVRLVRNQTGFPETAEDGIIIFDEYATEGTVSRSSIIDGEDNPEDVAFIQGRQVYYRFFLFTSEKVWRVAGSIATIVPSNHAINEKFIRTLPRVFTSKEQSPLGELDTTSALYSFSSGLTFTGEILYTLLDLLRPQYSGNESPFELLPIETSNVGLTPEPALPTRNQKRLIREALYMYSHKGTKAGLETYVESLTGFAPTITVSPNTLLTVEDSTFYNSVGNWQTSGCTIETSTALVPATNDYTIDTVYSGKVTAIGSSYITLGADAPITKGIPVVENSDYTFSYKVKSPGSSGNTQMTVVWYDGKGISLGSDFVMASVSANNTWKTSWENTTSPAGAVYASLKITFSASGVYYVDQVYAEKGLNTDDTTYQEARAIDIFINPTKTNELYNPSFEVNATDGWTLSGTASIAQDVDIPSNVYSGTSSAKITATGPWTLTSNNVPLSSKPYYTFSIYLKNSDDVTVSFIGKDSLGNPTGHLDTHTFSSQADWTRISFTDLVNAEEAEVVSYDIELSGDTGTYYLDCAIFEAGQAPSDYFDGSLPSDFGAVWEGTADNSPSHLYYNKPNKIPRLGKTINDWIPPNTFWRLVSYAGVEYTNLTV